MRPKNTVSLTPRNKDKTIYDIWYYEGKQKKKMVAATTTILKALKHWKNCLFREDIT